MIFFANGSKSERETQIGIASLVTSLSNFEIFQKMQCDKCGVTAHKRVPAVEWNKKDKCSYSVPGDIFCLDCYNTYRNDLADFFPRPGYSKPARFIVARVKTATVVGDDAIVLSICFGNWIGARIILDQLKVDPYKRFHVKALKRDNCASSPKTLSSTQQVDDSQPRLSPSSNERKKPLMTEMPISLQIMSEPSAPAQYSAPHWPTINQLKKCPRCGLMRAITKDGSIRKHKNVAMFTCK